MLNLRFLRAVFGPELVLHGVRRTGGSELTCRWTMRMTLQAWCHMRGLCCAVHIQFFELAEGLIIVPSCQTPCWLLCRWLAACWLSWGHGCE